MTIVVDVKRIWERELEIYPDDLLQQILLRPQYPSETLQIRGWRMLVGCILLNQTGRKQVDRVWPTLFDRFPTPHSIAYGGASAIGDLYNIVKPLGLGEMRQQRILSLSVAWLEKGMGWSVEELPGCGQYAQDSWDVFVLGRTDLDPMDKELRRHLGLPAHPTKQETAR